MIHTVREIGKRERECGSGGSETRYQTEPPKTSHRLQQPPSYVSVRPSATTTNTFIKKTVNSNDKRLFSLFPVGHDVYSASDRFLGENTIVHMYGCWWFTPRQSVVAQSNGGTTENGARRKVGLHVPDLSSIVYRKLRRRCKKDDKTATRFRWSGWGRGKRRERERWFPWEKQVVHYTTRVSRTAPATPYSPSFTYRRSCVNVFDDLNLLKSLKRKKTDCRQTVSDCQTLRRSTTSGIEEVLCHKRRH